MPFGGLGFGEMILIFAVLLLVFGAKRLPEIGGAMGRSIRDFKRSINGLDEESVNRSIQNPATHSQIQNAPPAQESAAAPVEAEAERPQG